VPGRKCPGGCVRRQCGLCQCESGSGASLDACARHGKRRGGVCHEDTAAAVRPRVMARCPMACLTGKCVPCGMAAPVIGGEGSEALCERSSGSGGAGAAQAAGARRGSRRSCYVREHDTAGASQTGRRPRLRMVSVHGGSGSADPGHGYRV